MIVTSLHDLIVIMIVTSVPLMQWRQREFKVGGDEAPKGMGAGRGVPPPLGEGCGRGDFL